MRSQIGGIDIALRNSQDGISLLQTAEGALGETNSMLQRMRDLAVQASNDSLTSQDRQYLQLEIDELKKQIDKIAGMTQFNRKRLLDGSSGALWSSSDLNLSAKINGGLAYVDENGQKVSSEGNYRIEVRAEAGEAQVQKSNIFNLEAPVEITRKERVYFSDGEPEQIGKTEEEIKAIEQEATIIEIDKLSEYGETGEGWNYFNMELTITGNGKYKIVGNGTALTDRHIKISGNTETNIFLSDVNIDRSRSSFQFGCAFAIESGAKVDMYLESNNSLISGYGRAGLEVPEGAELTISSASGDGSRRGALTATGGYLAAGIGGGDFKRSVNIYNMRDYPSGVENPYREITREGLASSSKTNGGKITIMGGTVNAQGGMQGAGIGGGFGGNAGEISIVSGEINASGLNRGAGIGSGHFANWYTDYNRESVIKISGGYITAKGGDDYNGYYQGAGIGGGCHSDSGNIIIRKGLVNRSDKDNGMINRAGSQIIAIRGGSDTSNNTAQDIGHGTDSNGEWSEYALELDEIPGIPSPALSEFVEVEISDTITRPSTLRDMKIFYNSEGVYLVEHPQTLTITQGNGKSTNVTLYPEDTIFDVAERINNAICESLGQGAYTDNRSRFCTIASGPDNTSESVCTFEDVYRKRYQRDSNGDLILDSNNNPIEIGTEKSGQYITNSTMLVRSAVPGKEGELYFSGDEELLNALGLNTIQESTESTFNASVYDAHSGARINEMKAEGSEFKSIIPPEIDIHVDPMTGLVANWDEQTKKFIFAGNDSYSAVLHLKNNAIIFQTGANNGEDFMIQLGDMSSKALGITGVNVLTRETASRAISVIDSAINKISSQRAKIGAYTNSLENTLNSLTITSANLTETDSRIRDADMSQAMMNFVKLQILNQSGSSMLAQANQIPQSVLTLMQ